MCKSLWGRRYYPHFKMGKLSLVSGLRLREAEEIVQVAHPVKGGASLVLEPVLHLCILSLFYLIHFGVGGKQKLNRTKAE